MKNFYYCLILLLLTSFSSPAQWSQKLFNGANVTVLKKVNNVCFAYGIDNNSLQGKLYRSDNNGSLWTAVDSVIFKFVYVKDITYDSAHSKYVICTFAQNGIFVSADGNTWTSTGIDVGGDGIAYINNKLVLTVPGNPDVGVVISTDGGYSFFSSNSGLPYPYYVHYVTRISNTLYIAQQATSPCSVSNNAGASWSAQSNGLSNFTNCFFKFKDKLYCGTYLSGVKKYKSTGTWVNFNKHLPGTSNIWALAAKGDSLFCGGDTIGVWMNVNDTWSNFSSGLPAKTTVHKLLTLGKLLYAATGNGLWKINLSAQTFNEADIVNIAAEKNAANTIKIFPTVTAGKLTIQSTELPASIKLINNNGALVNQWSNTSQLNISNVPAGNYFICININGKLFTQQIIKVN